MKTTAGLLSVLFHPLLLPSYAFLLVYATNPLLFSAYDSSQLSQIFLTVFINTFAFPALAILLVWKLGFVKSLSMDDAKERLVPYLTTGVFYIWAYVLFRKSGLPQILDVIILGATITLFAIFLVNLFWKVSAHAGAMGALMIAIIIINVFSGSAFNWLVIVTVLLAGLIGSCRMFLKAHQSPEVFAGYFIGMFSQVVAMQFY